MSCGWNVRKYYVRMRNHYYCVAQERKRAVYHGDGEELNMAKTDLISRQAAIEALQGRK